MFEVIVWDYDAAPDALEYFVAKRRKFEDKAVAMQFARDETEIRVGAAVFDEQHNNLAGFGLVLDYPS